MYYKSNKNGFYKYITKVHRHVYKQVCSLTKSTIFRSKSTLYNLLPYFVVYLLILPKGNMFGGDFTMHVFLFSFQAFVCNSSSYGGYNNIKTI